MFDIKVQEIFPGLIHLHFKNQYEVTSTMMRAQEFYESPHENIRGKFFELDKYMDTYAQTHGNFTYTSDWSGFNIPGNVVNAFFDTFDNALLEKEVYLKGHIDVAKEDFGITGDNFYLIASFDDESDRDILSHEIAHGFYYLNVDYRAAMDGIIGSIDDNTYARLAKVLLDKGYMDGVIDDEMQAYFSTSHMIQLTYDFDTDDLPWEHVLKCKKVFEEYHEKIHEHLHDHQS